MPVDKANPNTLVLDFPVTINGDTTSRLEMRRPTVEDQLAIEGMNLSQSKGEIHLFSNLTMVSPDVIKKMDLRDYLELGELYSSFLERKSDGVDSTS